MPTRLIAIGDGETRLCPDTTTIDPSTPYASLSHCWGLNKFLTLVKANFADFIQEIPPEGLTKTFKEAIFVARSLGFEYIWIDSLCIVQDDTEDWKRESVRMGSVYGRSALNIAATGAPNGQMGCFFDQQDDWRFQLQLQNGTVYECFIPEALEPRIEDTPLMSRAWVVQERFLAPRTLHFTKQQVFWVCRCLTACEVWPGGIPRPERYVYCSLDLPKGPNWLSQVGWPTIVEQYSSCQLTMGRDKLVAISAIAQHIQKDTPDEYIAGMWRTELASQLCWSTQRGKRYSPAVAPTWSWASNSAPIGYFNSEPYTFPITKVYIEITSVDIKYQTPTNPFGEVISGALEICCEYLKECTVYAYERNTGIIIDDDRSLRGNTIIEAMGFDAWEEHARTETFRAFWLPIVYCAQPRRHNGIVLLPTGVKKGQYKRIGNASVQEMGNSALHFPSELFLPKDDYCTRVETTTGGLKRFYISII